MHRALRNVALATGLVRLTHASFVASMSPNAQELFNQSIGWMDTYYDSDAGYLYDFEGGGSALRHETRTSVWYALGLLARNADNDVAEAERIVTNVIGAQFRNESAQWYGDYQRYPEEPMVGTVYYPSDLYNSWDPNWRGFVGTTLVMIMEEFSGMLSNVTQDLILESLSLSAQGDTYRVGGVDGDNLYPSYSNPSIMRALVSGWTGRRINDQNMTQAGEKYAQEIADLFNNFDTLSEFNSGTYTGVSLFGLVLWCKYLPGDSIMAQQGPKMLQDTWSAVGQLWHPGMKNMAGPWDRAYGYDMNRYLSIMSIWFWTLIGKDKSGLISKPQVMSHSADYPWGVLIASLADYHASLLPEGIHANLSSFSGEHVFEAQAYYPPYDKTPRNITTWLSENLTIGAESYEETNVGGPSESQTSFNPAVIQWTTGDEVAFISLYPTEPALQVDVSAGRLNVTYPQGNASSIFTLVVSTFKNATTITGWDDVPSLDVSVSGNINQDYTLSFCGRNGGSCSTINDFEMWNFTYTMDTDFQGTPHLCLDLEHLGS
ncbi:hypothetical protein F4780DRAFT_477393 [Xylariomycetidae sp. FL0641]|nr:hypothetical protein F4780DRAFT_477393 [Xylariomycetidae sp. FL0641]